ncbi:magnesium-translocating P-type ATPase [Candidatus Falkowbacteria bacterium CG10_big_fil_rev_8_21_14_0_10_39_9]|uniref:Magnesium-transporting ATPase, P-type 1 n=1 Tax=Candidatus Falkowbacteria bacterium CG10_big_fil_rev_8_21_14_0_10_39_9 TaxID=1974566 RepID=A0A2M6WQ27_9BACT|nr:MAG: magnesium-translocating P-type ATPase [Candidatus Falkowbacteria bacterium CG10_big_fil_rev_8_21_14_0_10_39_9]
MNYSPTENYQNKSAAEMLALLQVSRQGLSEQVVSARLKLYGANDISHQKKESLILKFLGYFKNPMIIILMVAATFSGFTGSYKSTVIIFIMIFFSVILNFYQEHRSSRPAEKIAKKLALRANVFREGKKKEIVAKLIVPGDIILLSAGDIIPSDGVLLEADDFFVNESVLTGESFPTEKSINDPKSSQIFSGTNVISGYARYLTTKTGLHTEYGQIAAKLGDRHETNAFELGIKDFGYLIIKIIMFIVIIIFLINAIQKKDIMDSIIFSIAVAVGVTPELLPMIMSVNMARGSIKMSKKGVIVKRLNAIPDFGSMDILCTDKTGTLTQDKITVVKFLDNEGAPAEAVLKSAYLNGYFETGIKSLLDKALLDFKKIAIGKAKKIDEIPYDFMRRRSSIVFEDGGQIIMTTKGAPEEIFKICGFYQTKDRDQKFSAAELKKATKLYNDLSSEGFRVLAIATKNLTDKKTQYEKGDENEMTLIGFIAFYDPPKLSAKETVTFMASHGIEMKIITGDSPLVAKKICEDLDIKLKGIITGDEFDVNKLSHAEMLIKARANSIFARFSPMQKEKVIEVLRQGGSVVGYLGDGVNDAPSLKMADVGISVDNAVDVAKETADIILMKKGLQELMEGVLEGRKTFGNTMKYIMMGLSSNFGNMFSLIGASLFLPFFPMLPSQILLNNFLYDTSQLSIPSDNVDAEYLKKPKHWDIKMIKRFMIIFGPISSIFDILTFVFLYFVFKAPEATFQAGWFVESLATQVLVIHIIRTRRIPFLQSRPSKYLLMSTVGAVLLGVVLTMPFIGGFFNFNPLTPQIFLTIIILVVAYLLVVEVVKQLFFKKIYQTE